MSVMRLAHVFVWAVLAADATTTADLTGAWYGNSLDMTSGARGDNIVVRNPDGTFVLIARLCDRGQLSLSTESGTWQLDDGILTTRTTAVDGHAVRADDFYVERYRVRVEDERHILLDLQRNPQKFRSERIDARFAMPANPCIDPR